MTAQADIRAEVLGKLLLIQETLDVLPDNAGIAAFLRRALSDIPGVIDVHLCVGGAVFPPSKDFDDICAKLEARNASGTCADCTVGTARVICLPLRTARHLYGMLLLSMDDEEAFSPYRAFVQNIANVVATTLETREHVRQLDEARAGLEIQVAGRTATLKESQDLLRTIVENVPIRVFWKDTESRYLGCNTAFAHDAGMSSPEELLGKDDFQMGWREQAELYRTDDKKVMDSGIPKLGFEEPQTTPDGNKIWLRTSKVPLRSADGKVFGTLGIYEDITERKRDEEKLRYTQAMLTEAQRIARLGNWDWDIANDTLAWSDEIYRIFGLMPQQFGATYEAFLESVHPEDRSLVTGAVDRALRNEAPYTIDHRVLLPDGSVRHVHERAETTFDADGKPLRMLGIVEDITEQKLATIALNRLYRAMQTLSRCNEALVHATDERQLLDAMCRIVVEIGGYGMAWVSFAEHDIRKTVRPVAWSGYPEDYMEKANITWADVPLGRGPTGTAIRSGTVQVVQDALTDPGYEPWRVNATKLGYASVTALPLAEDGRVFGAITIHSAEANRFDNDEVRLLEELAADLAFGIIALRTRAAHEQHAKRLQKSMETTIQAMAATLEMRDPYTAGHQRRVAELAVAIGREMGLDEDCVHSLHLAGIVHDLGKIYVPAEILAKPAKLTDIEFMLIKTHAQAGYDILKKVDFPWPIAQMVLQHHERMDGSGYPNGLKNDEILLEARILAVADVVEAISSHRPYRAAFGIDFALEEITKYRGTQFDPVVVDATLRAFREKGFQFTSAAFR